MNKRYEDLRVSEGVYVPEGRMDYPEENPYEGLYKPVYDRAFPEVDSSYPYVDDSWQNRVRVPVGVLFVRRRIDVHVVRDIVQNHIDIVLVRSSQKRAEFFVCTETNI